MANGWTVHESRTSESYDILATDPITGEFLKIQVKTIRERSDRLGELVIYAKKGNGTVYDLSDADRLIGIWAKNGETPKVYMLENEMKTEYWCREELAPLRWTELPIALDRQLHVLKAVTSA